MSYEQQRALDQQYLMHTFTRKPVEFVRGEGMYLYDSEGKEYLDFLSGIGVMCLGHSNKAVTEALTTQAQKLVHVGNYYYVEGRGEYARDLSHLLNDHKEEAPWKTFFANSGAEANEGAIKLARKYGKLHREGAGTILSLKRSFHGRTLAGTAATAQEIKQESFTPMPSGFGSVAPNELDELVAALDACTREADTTNRPEAAPIAVLLECVQGEGGVWPLDDEYLRAVRTLTEERGLLMMIDEVQTGFYRTGRPFAFMHAGIRPDVVTTAKGIASGIPCAAVSATGQAADVLEPGEHGSTFGGSPFAIAAAQATLTELLRIDIGRHVSQVGAYFEEQLATLPGVKEVRGKGLMLALVLREDRAVELVDQALAEGFVFNSIGSTIVRFLPPLIVREREIDELIPLLAKLLEGEK